MIGLCNMSVYSASATTADTTTNPPRVIPGDSPGFLEHESLAVTPEPWEDGLRTDPTPDTFEWWYFEATLDDGSSAQLTFFTKPWMVSPMPFDPYFGISITTPNGTTYQDKFMSILTNSLLLVTKPTLLWVTTGFRVT
jgi:hypothetical protein